VRPVLLDVTDATSIDRVRQLVNAAGILVLGPVEAVPDQQTREQFEVNLFGALAVRRAFLPPMRERGHGRIVNVSSALGRFALPGSGLCSASKFALEAASDALRMELAPFGVQVVLVEPGSSPLHCTGGPPPLCPATAKPSSPTAQHGPRGSGSPSGC
jgi:NAD(P)-dependent dehydrogenase (short-subunit alcohol dehydrogenase family)